jgi:hypothetical protein
MQSTGNWLQKNGQIIWKVRLFKDKKETLHFLFARITYQSEEESKEGETR